MKALTNKFILISTGLGLPDYGYELVNNNNVGVSAHNLNSAAAIGSLSRNGKKFWVEKRIIICF